MSTLHPSTSRPDLAPAAARPLAVLAAIRERFERVRPLAGRRISICMRTTAHAAELVDTLRAGGADVVLCAPSGDGERHWEQLYAAVDHRPQVVIDEGADVIGMLHAHRREQLGDVAAATEGTPTGILRLRAMEAEGVLGFPVFAVAEAPVVRLVRDRFGAGQIVLDAILRATGMLFAGRVVVVAGYGSCGRGIAERARGAGARVIVTEVDPVRALEAGSDGYEVSTLDRAVVTADVICTATGGRHVVRAEHLARAKDGVVLCNAGHADVEIDLPALRALTASGRKLELVADGRSVTGAPDAQPSAVLDVVLAAQALAAEHALAHAGRLEGGVHAVPRALDEAIARLVLDSLGVAIDTLSPEQRAYLASWDAGAAR